MESVGKVHGRAVNGAAQVRTVRAYLYLLSAIGDIQRTMERQGKKRKSCYVCESTHLLVLNTSSVRARAIPAGPQKLALRSPGTPLNVRRTEKT